MEQVIDRHNHQSGRQKVVLSCSVKLLNCKKCNELSLPGYTFYSELCK